MLEQFVESKIRSERTKIDKEDDISKSDVKKSKLSPLVKRYIQERMDGKLSGTEFSDLLTKAIKLNINYTIRPKWTLLSYLFSKYDSQQTEVIMNRTGIFTFYRFYIDFITNYIEENALVVITKEKVNRFIDEANNTLHEKLMTNISGVKVKNFFIQIFRMVEKDPADVNLGSSVPFLFIRTFLEDKGYDDVLERFEVVDGLEDETELELKDVIKIMTEKYAPPVEKEEPKKEVVEVKEETIEVESVVPDEEEVEVEIKDKEKVEEPGKEQKDDEVIVVDFKKWEDTVDEDKEDKKVKKVKEEEIKEDITTGVEQEPIPTEEEMEEQEEEPEDVEVPERPYKMTLPTHVIEESNLDVEKKSIGRLFKTGELSSICQVVYHGNKHFMHESFRTLKEFDNWKEAAEYIKDLFYEKDVDIDDKTVLLFVDVLNDYYNQLEK